MFSYNLIYHSKPRVTKRQSRQDKLRNFLKLKFVIIVITYYTVELSITFDWDWELTSSRALACYSSEGDETGKQDGKFNFHFSPRSDQLLLLSYEKRKKLITIISKLSSSHHDRHHCHDRHHESEWVLGKNVDEAQLKEATEAVKLATRLMAKKSK